MEHQPLSWEAIQTLLLIFEGSYQATPILRVGAQYSIGSIVDGDNTDEDFEQGFLDEKSEADTEGDVTLWNITAYLNVTETHARR